MLAFFAGDWVGGIVANAAQSTRAWWRTRPKARQIFHIVHILEIPLIWWLTGGGLVFYLFMLVLFAKLVIFEMGQDKSG